VTAKIILKTKRNVKTKKIEIKKWNIVKLNMKEVKEKFTEKVRENVQNTQLEAVEDINEKRNKIKKKE